jgi:hypothetical protein
MFLFESILKITTKYEFSSVLALFVSSQCWVAILAHKEGNKFKKIKTKFHVVRRAEWFYLYLDPDSQKSLNLDPYPQI